MSVLLKVSGISVLLFVQSFQCKEIGQNSIDDTSNGQIVFAHTILSLFSCTNFCTLCCRRTKSCVKTDKRIELCRHGHRNVYKSYPNDPWKAEENWPGGYAQLTKVGKLQQYELGQFLRKRYKSLLGNGDYSPNKIYVESSDLDRTIMSALANLAGLFPPISDEQLWNRNLEWQPVPVHTLARKDDYLLAGEKRCDRFDYLMLQYMNGSEYKGWFKQYRELITYLETNAGMKLPTITKIFDLFDHLYVERLHGLRLPEFAEKVTVPGSDFEKIALYWFQMFTTSSNEMKMLRSGYLLKEILDRFTNKLQSKEDRSLWMYFAHDITLANTLNSLGLFDPHLLPFASCIFFELYKPEESSPYVQIVYRNSTESDGVPLKIPNCGPKCPLHKLYEIYNNILPTQTFDAACELRAGETLPSTGNPENSSI